MKTVRGLRARVHNGQAMRDLEAMAKMVNREKWWRELTEEESEGMTGVVVMEVIDCKFYRPKLHRHVSAVLIVVAMEELPEEYMCGRRLDKFHGPHWSAFHWVLHKSWQGKGMGVHTSVVRGYQRYDQAMQTQYQKAAIRGVRCL